MLELQRLLDEGYAWSDRRSRRLDSRAKLFWKMVYKVRYVVVRI